MSNLSPTETVAIGSTGLRVPRLCFGTSGLGDMPETYGYGVDEAHAAETFAAIFEGPVNFIDTSRNYGAGRSEKRIGDAIRTRGGLPDGFIISSKLDRDMTTNGFSAERARQSLDESLTTMGIDHIPILHLHDPEYSTSVAEITAPSGALDTLFKMKEEGLTKAVGLAAGRVDIMMPILRDFDFDVLITHNRFTLLNQNADEMIDFAGTKNISVLNAAPFNSGILAKGPTAFPRFAYQEATEATLDRARQLEQICSRHNIPLGAAAMQYSLRDPRIASTIFGITRPERIQQSIDWANHPISDTAWEELLALTGDSSNPEASRDYKPD